MPRNIGRFLAVAAAQGIIGYGAIESIKATVTPGVWRDAVLLAIWPLVIVAGTIAFVVWIWRAEGPISASPQPQRSGDPLPTGTAPAPSASSAPRVFPISEPTPPPPTRPPYEQLADGRVVYNVNLDQLMGLFKDQTTAQGNRQALPWIGKFMRFSGSVFNVNEHDTWAMVAMKPELKREGLVFASFNTPDLMSQVAVLKRDDRIGVIGRIHQIEWNSVSLEDCELVEP